MDMNRIKDRIRKLLTLAKDDSAATGEIENAMRFAQALMDEHHVSAEDVHAAAGGNERREYELDSSFSQGAKLATWECTLAHAVSFLCGVKWYHKSGSVRMNGDRIAFDAKGKKQRAGEVCWYGEVGDVAEAIQIYAEWSQTIAAMARMRFGGALKGDGAYYAYGFAQAIRDTQNKPAADSTDAGNALAVRAKAIVAVKHDAAKTWLETTLGTKLQNGHRRSVSLGSGEAYRAGKRDGAGAGMARTARVGGRSGVRGLLS